MKVSMKSISLIVIALAFIPWFRAGRAYGQEGDIGIPDSAYVMNPQFEIRDCERTIMAIVPIYLFSDDFYYQVQFNFSWQGDASFEGVLICGHWAHPTAGSYVTVDTLLKSGEILVGDAWHPFWPGSGIFVELSFLTRLGDTLGLSIPYNNFTLLSYDFNAWPPTYQNLNGSIPLPDTLAMSLGDADCSGSVDISDAVFLIGYIFAGGIPPYDRNAADANGDCAVDISDAVYLIAYIFSGGPGPQVGCVVP